MRIWKKFQELRYEQEFSLPEQIFAENKVCV
jgi:hypothetical protein